MINTVLRQILLDFLAKTSEREEAGMRSTETPLITSFCVSLDSGTKTSIPAFSSLVLHKFSRIASPVASNNAIRFSLAFKDLPTISTVVSKIDLD